MTLADDDDVWVHHALFPTEIKKTGSINPKIFSRPFGKRSRFPDCDREISGRMLSLATSIEAFARTRIAALKERNPDFGGTFLGAVYGYVANIRAVEDGETFDVYIEEMEGDVAHADVVAKKAMKVLDGDVIDLDALRPLIASLRVALPESEDLKRLEEFAGTETSSIGGAFPRRSVGAL